MPFPINNILRLSLYMDYLKLSATLIKGMFYFLLKGKEGGKYLSRKRVADRKTGKMKWVHKYKPTSQKGAHEVTKKKFEKVTKLSGNEHKNQIEHALQNGIHVSLHVLRDYPDLITKYHQQARIAKADKVRAKVKAHVQEVKAVEEQETAQEFFELPNAENISDIKANISKILFQYASKQAGVNQANRYLRENRNLALELMKDRNITSQEGLNSYLEKLHPIARKGKGKERKEGLKKFQEERTNENVNKLIERALKESKEFNERLGLTPQPVVSDTKEVENNFDTMQDYVKSQLAEAKEAGLDTRNMESTLQDEYYTKLLENAHKDKIPVKAYESLRQDQKLHYDRKYPSMRDKTESEKRKQSEYDASIDKYLKPSNFDTMPESSYENKVFDNYIQNQGDKSKESYVKDVINKTGILPIHLGINKDKLNSVADYLKSDRNTPSEYIEKLKFYATEDGQKELKSVISNIKKDLEGKAFEGIDRNKLDSFTIRTNPTKGEVTIDDLFGIYGITNRQGKWTAESPNGKVLLEDANLDNVINKVQQATAFIAAKNNKSQYYKDLLNIGKMDRIGLQNLIKSVQENGSNEDQKKLVLDKINSLIKAMPESKPEAVTPAKSPLEISSMIDRIGRQVSDSPLTEMPYARVSDLIYRTESTPERKQVSEKEVVQSIFNRVTDDYVKERLAKDYPDYVQYSKVEQAKPQEKTSFDAKKMDETIRGLTGLPEQKKKEAKANFEAWKEERKAAPAFKLEQEDITSKEKNTRFNDAQGGLFGKKPVTHESYAKKDFKPALALEGNETITSLVTAVKSALMREGLDSKAREFVDRAFKEKDMTSLKKMASEYVDMKESSQVPSQKSDDKDIREGKKMEISAKEVLDQINRDGRQIGYIKYDAESQIAAYETEREQRFQEWAKSPLSQTEKEIIQAGLGRVYRGMNKRGFVIAVRTPENESFHDWNLMTEISPSDTKGRIK